VILLQGKLDVGNKWSSIAKKLPGRCENAVKNRYALLYKKYNESHKTDGIKDITLALDVVNKDQKIESDDWIKKAIADKMAESTKSPKKPRIGGLAKTLMHLARNEIMQDSNDDTTCTNQRYIARNRKKTKELMEKGEYFKNPKTGQELYFTDEGLFIFNEKMFLVPLRDMSQLVRKNQINPQIPNPVECSASHINSLINADYKEKQAETGIFELGSKVNSPALINDTNFQPISPNLENSAIGLGRSSGIVIPPRLNSFDFP